MIEIDRPGAYDVMTYTEDRPPYGRVWVLTGTFDDGEVHRWSVALDGEDNAAADRSHRAGDPDWLAVSAHVREVIEQYLEITPAGDLALRLVLYPLVRRFNRGKRTPKPKLYEEMRSVE